MEIVINDKEPYRTHKATAIITWEQYYKKYFKNFLIQYGIGLLFLVIGFITFSSYNQVSLPQANLKEVKNIYYNLHLIPAIGIVYILITTVSLFKFIRRKSSFLKNQEQLGLKFYSQGTEMTIKLKDEYISCNTTLYTMEIKWDAIINYSVHKDFLFLNMDNESLTSSIVIHREIMRENDYSDLLSFIKSKFPEKTL